MADRVPYRFVLRRGLAAEWTTQNGILLEGEFGLELDTGLLKIGDGVTAWNGLPYYASPGDALIPTRIPTGETFVVPADKQALYAEPIRVDGVLSVDGVLVEVDTATQYTDDMARSAVVIDSIADADTTHAPSRNAVFDALALKRNDAAVIAIAGLTADQTLSNATATKVNLNTESADTHGFFDTTTGRFTPTIAGLYQVVATAAFVLPSPGATSGERIIVFVYKNGAYFSSLTASTHSSISNVIQVVTLIPMNGSGDYLEMYCRRDTTAAYSIGGVGTSFSVIRVSA